MVQKGNKIIPVEYLIFEDIEGERYLSPDIRLLQLILPEKSFVQATAIKTAKTVNYLIGHKNAGNNIDLINISKEKGSISSVLEKNAGQIIKTENNVAHLLKDKIVKKETNQGSIPRNNNTNKISLSEKLEKATLERVTTEIPKLVVYKPLPYNVLVSSDNTNRENEFLIEHLNYYLKKLGLKQIKNISSYRIFDLSTIGDKMIALDLLLEHGITSSITDVNIINSNRLQQFAMAYLGFIEFLYAPEHLAGTFFETIYAISKIQGNQELSNKLTSILINHLEKTKPYDFPEFIENEEVVSNE